MYYTEAEVAYTACSCIAGETPDLYTTTTCTSTNVITATDRVNTETKEAYASTYTPLYTKTIHTTVTTTSSVLCCATDIPDYDGHGNMLGGRSECKPMDIEHSPAPFSKSVLFDKEDARVCSTPVSLIALENHPVGLTIILYRA